MEGAALADEVEWLGGDVIADIEPHGEHRRQPYFQAGSIVSAVLGCAGAIRHRCAGRDEGAELAAARAEGTYPGAFGGQVQQAVVEVLMDGHAGLLTRVRQAELAAAVCVADFVPNELLRVECEPGPDAEAVADFVLARQIACRSQLIVLK